PSPKRGGEPESGSGLTPPSLLGKGAGGLGSSDMTDAAVPTRPVPRWLHAWAVLTVCVTVVLLVLGQLVTTFRAGMADPIRPTVPLPPVGVMGAAFGLLVGLGATGMLGRVRGSGLRLLAVAALVGVMVQGLLGGLRVKLNALVGPELAPTHGVFAQIVFSL